MTNLLSLFDGNPCVEDPTPREGSPAEIWAARVAESLRSRRDPGDMAFDRFLPRQLAVVSGQYWTPLVVTMRVAEWLADFGIETVADIGSGAGKFCVATALSGNCRFVGLEQRPRLVRTARHLARLFRVEDRVHFLHGSFGDDQVPVADAYYLYNPFGENLFGLEDRLDNEVEIGEERYSRDVEAIQKFLTEAPVGTFVVTYNGFGGSLPRSYTSLRVDRELPNVLRISRKDR